MLGRLQVEEVVGKAGRLAIISMLKKVLRIDGEGCEEPGVAGGISINVWLLPRMYICINHGCRWVERAWDRGQRWAGRDQWGKGHM